MRSIELTTVSVVMAFHNEQRFLREALESVLSQSFQPFEILLVDDGSTDGSVGIAAEFARLIPTLSLLTHPGHEQLGVWASRALGIQRSSGTLVAFLDADDRWDPEHLAAYVRAWVDNPQVGMVVGRAVVWNSWADRELTDSLTPLAFPPGSVVSPPDLLSAVLRDGAVTVPVCSFVAERADVLRAVLSTAGLRGIYEDQALLAILQLRCCAVVVQEASAYYRKHSNSTTAKATARGEYHPALPNPSRSAYLTWLGQLLEVSGSQLMRCVSGGANRTGVRTGGDRLASNARHLPGTQVASPTLTGVRRRKRPKVGPSCPARPMGP